MSLASLIGIDKERYDQGNTFLSQDPYLQNFQGRAPITFNQSAPNVDTMYGGNTSIYGTPTNTGGDSMGATMPTGNFNQKSIGSLIDPMYMMSLVKTDKYLILHSDNRRFKYLAGTVGNYGLRAFASQMGAQGGAMLGRHDSWWEYFLYY
jgi:hypothetical protein